MDKEELKRRFHSSDRTLKTLFSILLEEHAKANNKKKAGAKFPVNIIYADKLLEWYPQAKIIHLTRDPRAIYPSMYRNILKSVFLYNKNHGKPGFPIKTFTLAYLIYQYKKSAKFFKKHRTSTNYYLSRFEDILENPAENIKKVCSFLEIHFRPEMLYPPVSDSSFSYSNAARGLDKSALER